MDKSSSKIIFEGSEGRLTLPAVVTDELERRIMVKADLNMMSAGNQRLVGAGADHPIVINQARGNLALPYLSVVLEAKIDPDELKNDASISAGQKATLVNDKDGGQVTIQSVERGVLKMLYEKKRHLPWPTGDHHASAWDPGPDHHHQLRIPS